MGLEKEMATHSSIVDWKIPWTEEAGGLQSMGSQRVVHSLVTENQMRYTSYSFLILQETNIQNLGNLPSVLVECTFFKYRFLF